MDYRVLHRLLNKLPHLLHRIVGSSDRYANSDSNRDADSNTNGYSNQHIDKYSWPNEHVHGDTDVDSNLDSNEYTNDHKHTYDYPDGDSDPNTFRCLIQTAYTTHSYSGRSSEGTLSRVTH
jgi:hypothetical protein